LWTWGTFGRERRRERRKQVLGEQGLEARGFMSRWKGWWYSLFEKNEGGTNRRVLRIIDWRFLIGHC
jgi:hypothetical protein